MIPDHLRLQEMGTETVCKAVEEDLNILINVSDWFVRIKLVEMWYDDQDYSDDDEFVERHNVYKKRKILKNR